MLRIENDIISSIKSHVVFWILFITYELSVNFSVSGQFSPILDYITYYTLNISLFYFHAFVVLRIGFNRKLNYLFIGLCIVLEVMGYLAIKYLIVQFYNLSGIYSTIQNDTLLIFVRNSIWRAIYFLGLGSAFAFGFFAFTYRKQIDILELNRLQNQLDKEKLEKGLLNAEINYRKAQINPHFIFNTLSYLHNHVSAISEEAAEIIVDLSESMRYALTEPGDDGKVPLESEISHINDYLRINRFRFNQGLNLHFEVSGDISRIRIIPLVLITIIENIFKYAELRSPEYPATVVLTIMEKQLLVFHIKNRILARTHAYSTGIGISNVKKRLELHYPGSHEINILNDGQTYQLSLMINTIPDELLHS